MTLEKKETGTAPFIRAVTAHHTTLLGEREALLTDLQVLGDEPAMIDGSYSLLISEKLDSLSELDSRIDTIQRYFSTNDKPKPEEPAGT